MARPHRPRWRERARERCWPDRMVDLFDDAPIVIEIHDSDSFENDAAVDDGYLQHVEDDFGSETESRFEDDSGSEAAWGNFIFRNIEDWVPEPLGEDGLHHVESWEDSPKQILLTQPMPKHIFCYHRFRDILNSS